MQLKEQNCLKSINSIRLLMDYILRTASLLHPTKKCLMHSLTYYFYFQRQTKSKSLTNNFNKITMIFIVDKFIKMIVQDYISSSTMGKHYYIKRKMIKDEALIYNGSIFPSSENNETSNLIHKKTINKHQTITTNIQHTITIISNNEDEFQASERNLHGERSQILPKIYTTSQSKHSRYSNAKSNQKQIRQPRPKEKALNNHISDPLYIKLEKTIAKRLNTNFNRYKKGWMDSSLRRKGKSVIQRSLQKAAKTIEHTNTESTKRRTNTNFVGMLRDNNEERKFSHPARIRHDIEPIKGKGGKVAPLIKQKFIIEEVYRYDKGQ